MLGRQYIEGIGHYFQCLQTVISLFELRVNQNNWLLLAYAHGVTFLNIGSIWTGFPEVLNRWCGKLTGEWAVAQV